MSSDSLSSSPDYEEFATYAAAAAGFTGVTRRVVCCADGTLVVKQAAGGTTRTLTVKAHVVEEINAIAFVEAGSSGCAPIKVYR